jgi:apolipoprotein N-acyltransferase
MLAMAFRSGGREAFRIGYVAGLTHYLASLYWLLHIPVMKLAPILAWLGLSGFLALYSGLWVWACWKLYPSGSQRTPCFTASVMSSSHVLPLAGWSQRLVWSLNCAALWVTWEMVQARLFTGFPWNFLGTSQFQVLPVIQISSVTGLYGVSFLVSWVAVSFLCAGMVIVNSSGKPWRWLAEVLVPFAVLAAIIVVGMRQLTQPPPAAKRLKVALVQPSIPQRWIWEPGERANRFANLVELSEKALAHEPDLLIWCEASLPGYIRYDKEIHDAVTNLVRRHKVWLVLGSDDVESRNDPQDPKAIDVFNSSFLMSPEGELKARYRKRRLVIFGEYIPLNRWLPFIERWTGMGSFTPGAEPVSFRVPELGFETAVLICFEDVFPHGVRESVEATTDFLINITNDGWFGESAAQWQHAASAVFRAVENGLPLVRCTNNGLTCLVDVRGRMHEVHFPGTKDIYGSGYKIVEIPLQRGTEVGQASKLTFYRRYGDRFGWGCVAWSSLLLCANVASSVRRKRAA